MQCHGPDETVQLRCREMLAGQSHVIRFEWIVAASQVVLELQARRVECSCPRVEKCEVIASVLRLNVLGPDFEILQHSRIVNNSAKIN